ncbi:G5 domain-containing protein [Murdochiella massiliensis]|uniref:G5 domain-containing protein n=1 Tax=Murdochiella massiliensis TaxID=1673723 RepID=UPI0011DDD566|nr:G5 domain-containing protein [Murdochiella massiliensis]
MNKRHAGKRRALILAGVLTLSAIAGSMVYAQRPKTVHLNYNGEAIELVTNKETLQEALADAKLEDLADAKLSLEMSDEVQDNMHLQIKTKKVVTLYDGDHVEKKVTYATNVGNFLEENEIAVDQDDVISPARTETLHDGDSVRVDHIETRMITENTAIPFKTTTQETEDMNIGETKVKKAGAKGNRQTVTKVVLKNGKPVEKKIVSNVVTKKAEEEVVLKGTHDPSPTSPMLYTLAQFQFQGVVYYSDYKYTFYSQSVLPGGGLSIPGRHVNDDGYVCDGDGYIVLAGSAPLGTVYPTPFGHYGKIYDRGTTGNHLDVYVQ